MTAPLLEVRDLCKYFPVFGRGLLRRQVGLVRAVDEVSFDLMPGETLGLVGESGCGKTTAGRTILRAHRPTRGRILFRDGGREQDLATLPEAALKPLRTRLQMIFQDPFSSLNPRMTVRDLVADPANLPTGCPFHPRCPLATARCRAEIPTLREVGPACRVACHEA